jgi:putative (di)nucleoside polyphosphate hydrolase
MTPDSIVNKLLINGPLMPPIAQTETYSASLPVRPCVGVVLFNAQGHVWVGRHRPKWAAQMLSYVGDAVWQLPQGGIEPREPSREAAFRELWEETGIRNASLIGEIPGWLTYELPPELIGIALKGKYAGHRLRWYAMRFDGDDSEIDIGPKGTMKSEFDAWRWVPLAEVPSLAVDFRRAVYEEVVQEFSRFARRRAAPIGAFDTAPAK